MLEAVDGELCLLAVLEVMRRMLLCILEAMEGGLCLLEVWCSSIRDITLSVESRVPQA